MIIVVCNHLRTVVQENLNSVGYLTDVIFLSFVKRTEMVVDMLFCRLCHTPYAVNDLAGKIIALIIVQSFVDSDIIIELCDA